MSKAGVTVSVVLCTYNGEKYLREQLESILSQTRLPDEILISDDGSTDSTLQVVEGFTSQNPETKTPQWTVLTRNAPLGVSKNFASALGRARGEFIALADQDDLWEPDRLEKQLGLFREGTLMVHSDAFLVDESGTKTGTLMSALRLTSAERKNLEEGRGVGVLLRRNVVTGATTMIHSSLIRQALPIPPGWIHDEWLALVAAVQGGIVFSELPLIHYRQHAGNEIGATKTDYTEAKRRLREKRSDFFRRKLLRDEGITHLLEQQARWLSPNAQHLLSSKVAFDVWRSSLPESRAHRVIPILRRWVSGDYGRFARGYVDVIRDLALTD